MAAPRTVEELAEAIGAAAAAGQKVSVAGSAHSFTETAMTDGTMVRVEALRGVLDADRESGLVRVGGGTVLRELNEALAGLGLALENLGDIDAQTVAGAISTGTHGTGAGYANISARVEAVELVLGDGSVRELTAAGEPELLRAALIAPSAPTPIRAARSSSGSAAAVSSRTLPSASTSSIASTREEMLA